MKKHIALLLAVVLLLSACSTAQSDSTGADETKSATETMNGTTDTTEGATTTEGSGETGSGETTQGTENTDGTGAATAPSTGNSDLALDNTKPTTDSTEPTQGAENTTPSTDTTAPTDDSNTKPTTNTTPTEPTTQPTTPTQPTTQPTTPTLPAETLKINTKNKTTVFVGDILQIDYSYSGNTSELTWSSTDTSVLTVDGGGLVTAKATGAATIKVTDGVTIKRVSITVADPAGKTIELKKSAHNAPLYDGVTKYTGNYMTFNVDCVAGYFMDGSLQKWYHADNTKVAVTSSNSNVVSVSVNYSSYYLENEITLNFKNVGTAKITIISGDGAISESYSITVKGDYACNPGSGQLTPEQFVNAYNGVASANGMNTTCITGYLVLTLFDSELTWDMARRVAEGSSHHWYGVAIAQGRTPYLCLTYEGINEDGKHVFYEHR